MTEAAEHLHAQFGYAAAGHPILDDVALTAGAGELVAIDAPSGAGSSLILAVLSGLARPTHGAVSYGGDPLGPRWHHQRALVEQDHQLSPELTAEEAVSVPLRARRLPRADIARRSRHWLDVLGIGEAADQLTTELSGGQRQRVGLARAFAAATPVLLLDDPTAELDADNRSNVTREIRRHVEAGGLAVTATHDPEVLALSNQVHTIRQRRLRAV